MGSRPDEGAFKNLGAVWGSSGVSDGGCGSGFFVQIIPRTNVEMKCGRLFVCLRWFFYGFYPMGFITILHHHLGEFFVTVIFCSKHLEPANSKSKMKVPTWMNWWMRSWHSWWIWWFPKRPKMGPILPWYSGYSDPTLGRSSTCGFDVDLNQWIFGEIWSWFVCCEIFKQKREPNNHGGWIDQVTPLTIMVFRRCLLVTSTFTGRLEQAFRFVWSKPRSRVVAR